MTCQPSSQPSQGSSEPSPPSWRLSDVQHLFDELVLGSELLVRVLEVDRGRPGELAMRSARAALDVSAGELLSWAGAAGVRLRLPPEPDDVSPPAGP